MPSHKLMIFYAFILCCVAVNAQQTYYVSPEGRDTNPGTQDAPFMTVAKAKRAVRKVNSQMTDNITVYLHDGVFELEDTLLFTPEDSGCNGYSVIYKAAPGSSPVISGGRKVSGWKKHEGRIFKAPFNYDKKLRQLTVNGKPARMARSKGYLQGAGGWGKFTIKGDEPWAMTAGSAQDGIRFDIPKNGGKKDQKIEVGLFRNAEDIELIAFQSTWTRQRAAVREIVKEGDQFIFKMQQPGFAFTQNQKWGAARYGGSKWQIVNAFELLDEPGEFYFDKQEKMLYYFPIWGEKTDNIYASVLEKLIVFEGNNTEQRVKNLTFDGITFSHNNFLLMDGGRSACSTIQATAMTVKFHKGGNWHETMYNMTRPMDGAIEAYNAEKVVFDNCRFEHLTGIGVNLINDSVDCSISNSVFEHITGSGVGIGHPQHYEIGDGDIFKEGIEGLCHGTVIHNNHFRDMAYEHIQCQAITTFFVADTTISHNDISGMPYSGMSIGWWWGNSGLPRPKNMKNISILNNRVTDVINVLTDGGAIYLLGDAPGSVAKGNYLSGAHTHHANGFHPDDSTSSWEITENVIEDIGRDWIHLWADGSRSNKVHRNFTNKDSRRLNGSDSYFANNIVEPDAPGWKSPRAREIIKNAGLLPPQKYRMENTFVIGEAKVNKVELAYAAAESGTYSMFVDGQFAQRLDITATGGWETDTGKLTLPLVLDKKSTVEFRSQPGDIGVNLTSIRFME